MPNTPHISQYPPRETFHVEIAIFTCGKVKNVLLEICFYICKIGRSSFRVMHSTLFDGDGGKVKVEKGVGLQCCHGFSWAPLACLQRPAFQVCWASGQDMGSSGRRERPAELCPPGHTSKPAFSATHLLSLPPSKLYTVLLRTPRMYIFYLLSSNTRSLCVASLSSF